MTPRIGIIDYGMGNLRSVSKAFEAIGCETIVTSQWSELKDTTHLVLPGVGAFGDGMKNLHGRDLIKPMTEAVVEKGRPFLGICLGMQLLAEVGYESGEDAGIGWIPGRVVRIAPDPASGLKVPHVGWNDVQTKPSSPLYQGLGSPVMYFVHSYHMDTPEQYRSGTFQYGGTFTASVEYKNIYATQFHPEKSHQAGLALLRKFIAITSPVSAEARH